MKATRSQRPVTARKRILILDDHPITRYGLTQLDRLPANAREWLNCWLDYKENRPYALAVLLDPGSANAGPDHPVVAHVKQIAAAAAADLFYSFCQTPIPAAQSGPAGITPSPRAT
jgi:hypothetical protein